MVLMRFEIHRLSAFAATERPRFRLGELLAAPEKFCLSELIRLAQTVNQRGVTVPIGALHQ